MAERKLTTFDYLLNRMESAAADADPAARGYGKARSDVLDYVRALRRLSEAQDVLLAAYRTNSRRTPGAAIDTIREARESLAAFDAQVGSPAASSSTGATKP